MIIKRGKEWSFMDNEKPKTKRKRPSQIKLGSTTYPPKPYLMFNEWIAYINKEFDKTK
tara:strand:- start:15454 stop:15627 length:174 start_codon:yes stop_codon:yes gene_type:complete